MKKKPFLLLAGVLLTIALAHALTWRPGEPFYNNDENRHVMTGVFIHDLLVDQIDARDFDGLVIPGGFAPDQLRRYEKVLTITREIYQAGKPVAFICHAGWVPISAKILKGKRATSVRAIKDDMENAGVIWEDAAVVVDGNLISSRTPADLPDFCKALIAALCQGPQD